MEISKLISKRNIMKKGESTFYRELGLSILFVIGTYYFYCIVLPKLLGK